MEVSSRAGTEPGTRATSRCSRGDPRKSRRASSGTAEGGARAELHPGARAPPGVRNPRAVSGRPGGRRAGIQLAWSVGPAGLRVSSAGRKLGPRSQDERGCGPRATPAPLPTWRPRPRGVSM